MNKKSIYYQKRDIWLDPSSKSYELYNERNGSNQKLKAFEKHIDEVLKKEYNARLSS